MAFTLLHEPLHFPQADPIGTDSPTDSRHCARDLSAQTWHMPITISIPHQLSRAEARRRIEKGFSQIIGGIPGSTGTCSQHWEGDRLIFTVCAMGQTASGVVNVLDHAVTMELDLPGMLGLIAAGLKGRLQKAGQLLLK
jgi:hypothetical protein